MTNENENAKVKEPRSLSEILADVEATETWKQQAHEKVGQQANKKLEQHVQNLLFRIEILKTRIHDPNRSDEIKQTFEEAIKLEESNALKRVAMWEYVSYLEEQGDCETAIPLAEKYLTYIEPNGDKSQIADATNMLGQLYAATGATKQAQQKFIQANGIYEQLVAENPSVSYQAKLARNDYDLCTLYADYGDSQHMDLAEQGFLRAKKIYEQLVAENLTECLPDLANTCNDLGNLYSDMYRMSKAERELLRAKKIREQLVAENPSAYLPDLVRSYNDLGILYSDMDRMSKAEIELLRAKKVGEQLAIENPSVDHRAKLARICYNLGNLYADTDQKDKAEQELFRSKKIYERLVAEDQLTYLIDLAKTCSCLGTLYSCMNRPELANEEFCRSRDLFEQDSKIHKFR